MDGNSLHTMEPGNLDDNSNNFCQVNTARSERANAKEKSEGVVSVSPEDSEGNTGVIGVHTSVPSDKDFPSEITSEQELVRSDSKNKRKLEMQKSDPEIMQVDSAIQTSDASTDANEALVRRITQKHSDSPVENSNNNFSPTKVDSVHVDEYSGNANILNDNCDKNSVKPSNTGVESASATELSRNNDSKRDSKRCQTESLPANKTNSLSFSNTFGKSEENASEDGGNQTMRGKRYMYQIVNDNDGHLLIDSKCNEAFIGCGTAEAKTSAQDEVSDTKEDADDFDDALEFVDDHFLENSDDERKEGPEEKVLISELSDVGRYSYACLVAHSLHTLFDYSSSNRKFQENCIKQIQRRLGQSKKLQQTMMMIVRGEISLGESDPLVDSLKSQFANPKLGALLIIADLLEMSLKEGIYDARMRTVLKFMSLVLGVLPEEIEDLEDAIQEKFREDEHLPTEEETEEKLAKRKARRIKRIALVSVAAISGGVLIGLTAGIAAPLIAIGAGAIVGGVGAAGLGTVAGAAIIGSIFGVAGAGLTGFKMKKRIGELEEFEFEPLTEGRSLHVTVAISGWLNDKHTDFRSIWLGLANSREQYILRYESKYMRELGMAMDYIANIAVAAAVKHTIKQTLFSGLLAAISWPLALLSAASIIDNPWSTCTQRSTNAGRQLAEVLLSRQQGRRPVTLIGFSFGARVIFSCLEEMASRKNSEGIVEDVILLGAPVTGCAEDWSRLEKVVAGRIVNGYSRGDWLLKFMYRTASAQLTIAGLDAVKWENRRMHNIDLTDIVSGHLDYLNQIDTILNAIGIRTVEHAAVGSAESLKQWTSLRRYDQNSSDKLQSTSESAEPLLSKAEEAEIATEDRLPVNEDIVAPVTATAVEAEGREVASEGREVASVPPGKDAD